MCSAVTWHERHGDKEALRTGKVWEARVAAWRGSHTLKKEKHARLVLGAARCPRLMYLLDQQRAGLDATDGCVDRERGRSVDPITCIVHIDLTVYETEYTQSKAAAAARRRRPATSLSQRCPSTRKDRACCLLRPVRRLLRPVRRLLRLTSTFSIQSRSSSTKLSQRYHPDPQFI